MKKYLMSLLVVIVTNAFAQITDKMYKMRWEEQPVLHEINEVYKDESVVVIKDHRYLNYKDNYQNYQQYLTVHKIIRVNDELGVKASNRISIPIRTSDMIYRLDVRTVSPSGKVVTLDKSNIKKIEEEGYNVRKFAVEGLEVGGQVEYIYTVVSGMRSFGREYIQGQWPIQSVIFKLYMPSKLNFIAKAYNGLNQPESKEFKKRKKAFLVHNYLELVDSNIDGFTKEGYSNFRSKLQRVDYKIQSSSYYSNLITWETLAKSMTTNLQSNKGDMKVLKFLKDLDLKDKTDEEKIAAIEYKIKSEIKLERNGSQEYDNIAFILKNKLASYSGLYRLYMKCFVLSKLDLTLVVAADRFNGDVDVNFPTGMDLDYPLFYFQKIRKYITPHDMASRLGYPAPELGGADGLYIRLSPEYYAKYYYSYEGYRIRKLPSMDMELTKSTNTAFITIEGEEALIDYKTKSSGYRALNDRMYMKTYLEQEDNLKTGIIRGMDDLDVESYKFENDDMMHSLDPNTPFILNAKIKSKSLVESLGDDILVKVGLIIGTQNKLYKEKNRVNDVIIEYKQHYERHIKVQIPEGYKCSNLEEFKKDISVVDEERNLESLFYHLNYTITDNVIDISVKEGYNTLEVKKENYQSYRDVVNSAADFNALTLVFEKL